MVDTRASLCTGGGPRSIPPHISWTSVSAIHSTFEYAEYCLARHYTHAARLVAHSAYEATDNLFLLRSGRLLARCDRYFIDYSIYSCPPLKLHCHATLASVCSRVFYYSHLRASLRTIRPRSR